MSTTAEKAAVMLGWRNGKDVQWHPRESGVSPIFPEKWYGLLVENGKEPNWNWEKFEFRLAPGQEEKDTVIGPDTVGDKRVDMEQHENGLYTVTAKVSNVAKWYADAMYKKFREVLLSESPPAQHLAKCGVCDWRQDTGSAEESDRVLARHMEEEHGENPWMKVKEFQIPNYKTNKVLQVESKPKKYRPWMAAEAIGKVVVHQGHRGCYVVTFAVEESCVLGGLFSTTEYKDLLSNFEQPDGTPCGVEVKE